MCLRNAEIQCDYRIGLWVHLNSLGELPNLRECQSSYQGLKSNNFSSVWRSVYSVESL